MDTWPRLQFIVNRRSIFIHPENLSDQVVIFAFFSDSSVGKGKQWLDAIHAQLAAARPAMAPATDATGVEDTNLFHIFDVMMRENREAVITEFTSGQV